MKKKLNKAKVLAVALGISLSANIGMYLHGQCLQNEIVASQEEVFDLKARNMLLKDTYNGLLGQMQETQNEVQSLQSQVEELQKWRSLGVFRITAYWMNEDEYGDMTSTGVKAQINHTIAVDPTVIPYGSKVKIDGQIYVAEDCGGAVKNNVIDVWVEHPSNSFGVKYKEIYIRMEN